MDRQILADDLNAFVDDMLPVADQARIRQLAAHDPAIAQEIAELRATARLLSELPEYAPRRSFRLGNEHAKASPPASPVTAPGRIIQFLPVVRSLSVAAALVFMVIAGSFFFDVNGGSSSDAGTTFQTQNEIMGNESETESSSHSSDETEDAESGESSMTSRGDAAAAGDDPMQDLTQLEEAAQDVAQLEEAAQDVAQTTTANAIGSPIDSSADEDRAPWVWTSVAFGGLTLILAGLWFLLAKAGRQSSAGSA